MEINHSVHDHPLFLREARYTKETCALCFESIFRNPFYVCEDCKVYVHKACAELPSVINHPFHPKHPLNLRHGRVFYCDSCHKHFKREPRFTCNRCDFNLDVECALMPKISPGGEEFIQHFTHQHPLSLCSQDQDKSLICFACRKMTSEVVYGCIPCNYFLHKSCSQLPTPILHSLHPQHALHLQVKYGSCHICRVHDYGFKFRCGDCNFCLDVSCWMEYTWKKEGQNLERECFICSRQHLDSISCVDSKYLLNRTCIWLPKEINHQFNYHDEPLQLFAPKGFWCESCHKWFVSNSCYGCADYNFHMDLKCALMPMVQHKEGEKYLGQSLPRYFRHQHPLCLITQDFGIICSVCQMTRPSPIYGCLQCEYFRHQSCIELPREIESPLHEPHKLTMDLVHDKYCHLCLKKYHGFFFGCAKCKFYIGIECYSLIPIFDLRYAYHKHPLCLVEKSYCEKCDSKDPFCEMAKFSSEFQPSQTYLLRCVRCDYNIHLLCCPLPVSIKDKNHLHGLKLTKSVAEYDCDDEYYCDVCEEERDPRLHVYYCEDCDFVSHVHCVKPEILSALKKDPGQVELRIARDLNLDERKYQPCYNASGKVLRLKNILDSLSEDETKEIEDHFRGTKLYRKDGDDMETEDGGRSTSKYEGNDIIRELSIFNDVGIFSFLKRLERFQPRLKYHIQPVEYELQVVEVEDCMITSNFAPLLGSLFKEYGDFGARTGFQKNFKLVIFYLICRMVEEQRRTCLVDLTERQLATFVYYCEGLRRLGFDISFADPFRPSLIQSFAGLQAMKLEGELPDKVALEIVHLQREIDRRKSYLLEFKPGNTEWQRDAKENKWRKIGWDII